MKVLTLEKQKYNLSKDFKQKLSEISGVDSLKWKMDYSDWTADSEEDTKRNYELSEEWKMLKPEIDSTYQLLKWDSQYFDMQINRVTNKIVNLSTKIDITD